MSEPISFASPEDAGAREAFGALGARVTGRPDADPVDGALALALAGPTGEPRARASLWIANDLTGASGPTGLIGHYEALEGSVGKALLAACAAELARRGVRRVLGPVNGDTWHRYRLELPREPEDPDVRPDGFASEPRNPPRYAEDFADGFDVVARYESRYEPDPAVDGTAIESARGRAGQRGLRLHALDPASFDETLGAMHALSLEAFADNPYYAPLPLESFVALYAPYRERVVPELVRLASVEGGGLAGYLFGFPDVLAIEAGRPVRTVCKTIAVAKDHRGSGLGGLLLDEFRAASIALGARGIVHALMHVDNTSMRLSSRRHSVLFKRYALYGREP